MGTGHWNRMGAALAWAAIAAMPACGSGGSLRGADRPQRLDGRWTLEFRLRMPVRLGTDIARVRPVRGKAFLIGNGAAQRVPGLEGTPTHYGTYAADFHPFELPHPPRGRVPSLAVRLVGGDSVEAVLDPGGADEFTLTGRLAGDSVVGAWHYAAGRGVGAGGSFVMHHDRSDADSAPHPFSGKSQETAR